MILFFVQSSVFSQCGSITQSCMQGHSGTCIGTNAGIPSSSALPFGIESNKVYFVTGTFAFNSITDHSIVGSTFIMDAGAQLIIGPPNNTPSTGYVGMDQCHIMGCSNLWQSILVKAGWSYLITKSKIEDSFQGIRLINGGNLSCRNNVFEDNYCSITFDQASKSIAGVYTSEFTSSGNDLLPGLQVGYTRPVRGIYVRSDAPNFFVNACYFHNIQNGILLNSCNMQGGIYPNNVFENIQPYNYPASYVSTGNGINMIGGTKTVDLKMYGKFNNPAQASTSYLVGPGQTPFSNYSTYLTFNQNFINCHRGIRIQDARADLQYNDMVNCNFGIVVTTTKANKSSTIWKNRIQLLHNVGIDINGNFANFTSDIFQNSISFEPSNFNRIGIRHIAVGSTTYAQPLQIRNNTIKIGQSGQNLFTVPSFGIELSGVAGTSIQDQNTITVYNPNMNYMGIYIHNKADYCRVENNYIRAQDQYPNGYSASRFGILMDESEGNDIRCNRFTKLGRYLNIFWECYESQIRSNIFVSGVQGLVYGDGINIEGLSGNQEGTGNRWLLPNGFTQQQARFNGNIGDPYMTASQYTVHANDTPNDIEFWPNTLLPIGGSWFMVNLDLSYPSGGCITGLIEPGPGLPDVVNDVVNNNTSNVPNDAYLWRSLRWHAYNYFERNPDALTTNMAAQTFLSNESATPAHKLWNIRNLLSQVSTMSQTTINNLEILNNQKQALAEVMIANIQQWNPINQTQGFIDTLDLNNTQYEQIVNAIDIIVQPQNAIDLSSYTQLLSQLNNISVSNNLDINQKFTLGIEIERCIDANYTLTNTEQSQLEYLAAQCHRLEGPGVLEARNLLTIYGIDGVQEDPGNCAAQVLPRANIESIIENSSNVFNVFPNPATNVLNVELSNENGINYTIEIRNAIGTLVKSYSTNTKVSVVNVSDLAVGIYSISMYSEHETAITKRWIKIK